MQTKIKVPLEILTAFVALTAIGGGVAILTGADKFPLEWLEGTPFRDYVIPALILAVVVGGGSLAACVALLMNHQYGAALSAAAGVLLIGQVAVEILILKQVPPGPTAIEIFYLLVGVIVVGLAIFAHRRRGVLP